MSFFQGLRPVPDMCKGVFRSFEFVHPVSFFRQCASADRVVSFRETGVGESPPVASGVQFGERRYVPDTSRGAAFTRKRKL